MLSICIHGRNIRIHEGGDLSEKEMIVLPKGATVYAPGTVDVRTTGPACEVNVTVGVFSDETIEELAKRAAKLMQKERAAPPDDTEIHLG